MRVRRSTIRYIALTYDQNLPPRDVSAPEEQVHGALQSYHDGSRTRAGPGYSNVSKGYTYSFEYPKYKWRDRETLTPVQEADIRIEEKGSSSSNSKSAGPASESTDQEAHWSPPSSFSKRTSEHEAEGAADVSDSNPDDTNSLPDVPKDYGAAYVIYHDPNNEDIGGGICDSRKIFEHTAVRSDVLLAFLQVLTGEASCLEVDVVEYARKDLPIFDDYTKWDYAEKVDRWSRMDDDVWLQSQVIRDTRTSYTTNSWGLLVRKSQTGILDSGMNLRSLTLSLPR